jgi:hypothetical protein
LPRSKGAKIEGIIMSDEREELSKTGKQLQAVEDAAERGAARAMGGHTPPIAEVTHSSPSTEKMWSISKEAATGIVDHKILKHASECEHEGPLCTVAKTVDALRVTVIRGTAMLAFVVVALPIALSLWNNHMASARAEDSLRKTIEAAANVAKELKAVQDAARIGHTMIMPAEAPRNQQLAKVDP